MSDTMLLGVLRLPITDYPDLITLRQFVAAAKEAADRIEQDAAKIGELEAELAGLRKQ